VGSYEGNRVSGNGFEPIENELTKVDHDSRMDASRCRIRSPRISAGAMRSRCARATRRLRPPTSSSKPASSA
jgi:hypothetical protein